MRRSGVQLLQRSARLQAQAAGDHHHHDATESPYYNWARGGWPSTAGSKWMVDYCIRNPHDQKWAPVTYGGNKTPSFPQFLAQFSEGHPKIEPLYHPKLTHHQKITRLYRRALRETQAHAVKVIPQRGLLGYYYRQVRAEFEKNRDADPGTAEWLFVRAINYIENKKTSVGYEQDFMVGRTAFARYGSLNHPDEYAVFPHGFDPEEAYKLMNPYHRYGIPFLGRAAAFVNPHSYMMRPHYTFRPTHAQSFLDGICYALGAFGVVLAVVLYRHGGFGVPAFYEEVHTSDWMSKRPTSVQEQNIL
ncbi:hypothetical protein DIPPA_20509 [Diplonema papillatum]|nr:hypothetical protein DIPPA_20509 [Diplonema papillatum]